MAKEPARINEWKKPRIKPLGKIKDVAGAQGAGAQAGGFKT